MSDLDEYEESVKDFRRWFHGVLSRSEAEEILTHQSRPYGFLVRKSDRPQMRDYFILSVCLGNMSCNHYDIYCAYGILTIGGYTYEDMRSILLYYHKNDIADVGEKLGFPVPPVVEPIDPSEDCLKATVSYKSEETNVLSFEQDDVFIKEPTGQEFEGLIYVSSLKSLTKGYVPANCVESHRRYPDFVSRLEYFHPTAISTDQLVDIMSSYGDGSYLLRPSETQPGCYSLQGMYGPRIRKFLIRPRVMEDEETSTASEEETGKCTWGLEGSDGEDKDSPQRVISDSKRCQTLSTRRVVFDTTSGVFPSVEAIVQFYTESDVFPDGVRLKRPIKYEDVKRLLHDGQETANGCVPEVPLAHEQLYDSFRHRNLAINYPHPDEAGIEYRDTLYVLWGKSAKKNKWRRYTCSLDKKKDLRLVLDPHTHKGAKLKQLLIQLPLTNYYPVDRSLYDSPYCFHLVMSSVTERESVSYLFCIHDPKDTASSLLSSNVCSPSGAIPPAAGLHNCTTASTVLNSTTTNTTYRATFSASFSSMQTAANMTPHAVPASRGESLSPTTRPHTMQASNSERFLMWQSQLLQSCCNTSSLMAPLRTVSGIEEHVREYHEVLLNVVQLSGPTTILKPHLMWRCQVQLGVLKQPYCVATTPYEHYANEPNESERRIVEWKKDFVFEHVPRNLERLVFCLSKKKTKNQSEQDYANTITLQMKDVKPAWFDESREMTLVDPESMRLSINVSYHKLLIHQNISYYQPLIDVLMDHMSTELVPFSNIIFNKTHLPACILRLAIRKGKVLDLIHEIMLYHILAHDKDFVRQDNLAVIILREYMIQSCVGWLRCVLAPLIQFLHQRYAILQEHASHNTSAGGGLSPSGNQSQLQNQSRRGIQRQPSLSEEASSSTAENSMFDLGDDIEQNMFDVLMEGIKNSADAVPLRLRHIYHDLLDILKKTSSLRMDDAPSPTPAAHVTCEDGDTEPMTPPVTVTSSHTKAHRALKKSFVSDLLFLRIIAPPLTGGKKSASLLHSTWEASPSHPLRNMVEQLYAVYDLQRRLDEEVSLVKITNEDRDLSEDEFLTKHFGSPCRVHPQRFPRKVFDKQMTAVAKRLTKCRKKLESLEKPLGPEEVRQLETSLKVETEACLKQSGWTQDMAAIEAILQYNRHKLEEAMGEGQNFSRLLKVLQQQ